ncbi:N-acetylneuraminate synthase family protein [Modestobacter sp. VKM Ac-2986]|uniref:N-acetylneuraminate synthase family protein n=1 Tax=Modestobacter sp. VKM Ac-2986 TaxID=3004140 RepID=UPI0022AB9B1C|nr:N-acetylneuraminate synthase family protein [Modestobacter sp. VKM Ac-2986]MCZ2829761.1 N-acetylneuraminate synthase family protein [Modestobacter sp. VKM Ac-2986]
MTQAPRFQIGNRTVGGGERPLVIAELGINHDGDLDRMHRMIDDAAAAGVECVKFQSHVVEDEMIPNDVVPGNADESIYTMMQRCALSAEEERDCFEHAHERGLLAISTPFSRAAADRLAEIDVPAFKIGSGECNNYPLVKHVASFGKPVVLSTGMNDISTIRPSVELLRASGVPFALMQCTSVYPTPAHQVRLGGIADLGEAFPDAVLGLSDHTTSIFACLGAVAVGADVLERHFTSDMSWPGPDIPISSTPTEFAELIRGADVLALSRGGHKTVLPDEQPTIDFAYASIVSIRPVAEGEDFTVDNLWVKRPGTGALLAADYDRVLGRRATRALPADVQLSAADIDGWTTAAR